MSRNFEIDAEVEHSLLRLRIFGPLAPGDVDALFEERSRLTAGFDCPLNEYRVLVDVREAPPQSEAVIERLDTHFDGLALDVRRAAIVLAPRATSARLQIRDISARYNFCLFDRIEDADRWIRL